MTAAVIEAAVVDTDVFSASLVPRSNSLASVYERHLVGRRLIIAPQTVAEIRFGALNANWGPRRLEEVERRLRLATVAPFDDDLAWAYARLRKACVDAGHALADARHDGDRWIAAVAVRFGLPLVAHDGIFDNVPGLTLITER